MINFEHRKKLDGRNEDEVGSSIEREKLFFEKLRVGEKRQGRIGKD